MRQLSIGGCANAVESDTANVSADAVEPAAAVDFADDASEADAAVDSDNVVDEEDEFVERINILIDLLDGEDDYR